MGPGASNLIATSGWAITATATDPSGSTSEFSTCVTATVGMAFAGSAYYRQSRLSDAPDVASMPGEVDRTMAAAALTAELPIAESVYAWHYEYDGLSRVTLACSNGWDDVAETCAGDEFIYEYDGAGNLTRFDKWNADTSQVDTVRYVINGANQIACIDTDGSGECDGAEVPWTYDAYGNLTDDGTTTYTYDAANRVETITAGGVTTTYTYNGDGDRIAQNVSDGTSPGTLTTYILDTATPLTMVLSETNASTRETTQYWHGLDTLAQSDGSTTEHFAYDGLGSVRQLVDETGSVGLAQTFDPYGNGYAKAGSVETTLGYTGEQTDGNGFVYLRARYYSPGMGRFTQMDPSRLEKNPYLYSYSNPLNYTDPSGLKPVEGWPPHELALEIIEEAGTAIDALIQLFEDPRFDRYPRQAGRTAKQRLQFILDLTSNASWYEVLSGEASAEQAWIQFAVHFGESGLDCEFQDGWLYDQNSDWVVAEGTPTNQIAHFLTAARLGFEVNNPLSLPAWIKVYHEFETRSWRKAVEVDPADVAVRLMVGHELRPDNSGPHSQYQATTDKDVGNFWLAMGADRLGDKEARDDYLMQILLHGMKDPTNPDTSYSEDPSTWGNGNSMADLRLSLKGYRFGYEAGCHPFAVYPDPICTLNEAADWLRTELKE